MRILDHIPSPEIPRSLLPALMVGATLLALLGAPGVPQDDEGVVALYIFARGPWVTEQRCLPTWPGQAASPWSDATCAPPADAGSAEFPSALVFLAGLDATTPAAPLSPADLSDLVSIVVAQLEPDGDTPTGNAPILVAAGNPNATEPEHRRPTPALPFEPLSEPVFASAPKKASAIPSASKSRISKIEPVVSAGPGIADRHAAAKYIAPAPGVEDFFAALPTLRAASHIREVSHRIRAGETVSLVFDAAGVNPGEISDWVQAAGQAYDLNRIYVGQQIAMFIDSRNGALQQMSIDVDRETVLVAARRGGKVIAQRQQVPHYRRLRVVGGDIARSLYATAMTRGIPERVVSDVAEILGWELDFATDLRPGATFRVVYEEIVRVDTDKPIAGRVLAVDINNRGRLHEGYYFSANEDTRGGYYNRKGNALGRAFLRYPVEYSRISSHFSAARYHPIKKRNVPHFGVDFAAKSGTPVVASADGTIVKAGWHNGNGRLIKIRHDRIYESAYAHMAGFAAGVKAGIEVKRGQTIGYVGQSGMATGPHLHYAMYKHGKYVDPLKVELPKAQPLTGAPRERFLTALALIDSAYAQAGLSDEGFAAVAAAKPAR